MCILMIIAVTFVAFLSMNSRRATRILLKKACVVRKKAFFLNQKLKFFCLKRVKKRWPGSNFCLFFEKIGTMAAILMPFESNFARV